MIIYYHLVMQLGKYYTVHKVLQGTNLNRNYFLDFVGPLIYKEIYGTVTGTAKGGDVS